MFQNNISKLRCLFCKSDLNLLLANSTTGILKCSCSLYPIVANIIYLKKDKLAKKAVFFIQKGNYLSALITLLNLRRLLLYPILLIFKFNKLFNKIGFQKTIKFLSFFSYSKEWFWYLINRDKIPSYHLSRLAYNLTKQNNPYTADLGCGVGKTLSNNSFGVDKSFVSLLLAKIFFVASNNTLICSDLEKGLPFKTSSLDLIVSADILYYVRNKVLFLTETERCLNFSGVLSVMHTLNVFKKGNILGLTPIKLKKLAENVGFKKSIVLSNETIWEKMITGKNRKINIESKDTNIDKCYAFNLFATKKEFSNKYITLPDLNKKSIIYRNDEELVYYLNFKKLLESFDNFIFLSPHFDDAVLSCGLLLNKLQQNKKNILVVTFFTKASKKPYSKEAKVFVHKSGYKDAEELFTNREVENRNALRLFSIKHLNLDFIDTVFRKNNYLENQKLKKNLLRAVNNIKIPPKTLLLAPLGLGNHPDHVLVNNLVKKLNKPVIFWEDFTYNTNPFFVKRFFRWNYKYKEAFNLIDFKNIQKIKAIQMYKSQMNVLFNKREIPNLPEKYFYLRSSKISTNFFAELSDE